MCAGSATRSASSVFLLALLLWAASAGAQQVRLLVQSTPLAGFRHHAGAEVWAELRVGDALRLEREAQNGYDASAVAVYWRERKLGYVPRRENAALAWAMDRGERLRARISRLGAARAASRRIELEVYLE